MFAELSIVIDRANNYFRGVRFSDSVRTASTFVSLTIIGPTGSTSVGPIIVSDFIVGFSHALPAAHAV